MALSVSTSNGGNGLSNLLRQTRPVKAGDEGSNTSSGDQPAATARPFGRVTIDSTGSGTAQITAALTIYLSKLGGADGESGASVQPQAKAGGAGSRDVSGLPVKSSASDLLRVLDTYGAQGDAQRLTA